MPRFVRLSDKWPGPGVIFAAVLLIIGTSEAFGQSQQLSRLYAREAYVALGIDRSEAIRLANVSLSYERENADALHARAAAFARDQSTRYRALRDMEAAVGFGGFQETSEREARLRFSRLLVDSMRYEEALNAISPVLEADPFDMNARVLELRALRESGRLDEAFARARDADRLFPDDPRVLDELIRLDYAPGYEQLRRLEEDPRPGDGRWLRAVLYYVEHAAGEEDRRRAVSLYREHGGTHPAIYVYDDSLGEEERVERFLEAGGGEYINLIQELYERISGTGQALLEAEFEDFSGELVLDRDRRGLFEQDFLFEDGMLARWRIDENVDGRPETVLRFDARTGEPEVLERYTGHRQIALRYRRYPEVAYADLDNQRLFLRPGAVEYPALHENEPWFEQPLDVFFDYRLAGDTPPVTQDSLLLETYLVQQFDDDSVVRSIRLRDGIPVLESSDILGDGKVDTVRYFENGQVRRVLRDPTGDGSFPVFEEYGNGVLSWTGYDSNRDGSYDVIESYEDGRRAEWDTEGDGLVDIRHFEFVDSRTRTDFLRFLDPPVTLSIDRIWTVPTPQR